MELFFLYFRVKILYIISCVLHYIADAFSCQGVESDKVDLFILGIHMHHRDKSGLRNSQYNKQIREN